MSRAWPGAKQGRVFVLVAVVVVASAGASQHASCILAVADEDGVSEHEAERGRCRVIVRLS